MLQPDVIAVVGAGNCGQGLAAELTLNGFTVRLCEHPAFAGSLAGVTAKGGITLTGKGKVSGFATPALVTTHFGQAVTGAKWILVTVPAYAHLPMAEMLAPHLTDGQVVVANPGCALGALALHQEFRRLGVTAKVICAETSAVTANTKVTGPGEVYHQGYPARLLFAAFPGKLTEGLLAEFRKLFPAAQPAGSLVQAALESGNIMTHPAPMVLNAGRVEYAQGEFWFYKEGITPAVGRVMDQQDAERRAVCGALGFATTPNYERVGKADKVAPPPTNSYEAYRGSERLQASQGPASLDSRYLTEDVPYGLVVWASLGRLLGVQMPVTEALITLASALTGDDCMARGRTLERLGLDQVATAAELLAYCEHGV